MRGLALFCFCACAGLGHANLFLNSEFDQVAVGEAQAIRKSAGSDGLSNWNILGAAILHIDHRYGEPGHGIDKFQAHSGVASVDLTGAGNEGTGCGISQTVATVPGLTYQVLFWIGVAKSATGNSLYSTQSVIDVSIDGGERVSYFNDQETPTNQAIWLPRYHFFTANGTTTNIAFFSGTSAATNNFVGIDSVDVDIAVPEPATFVALGIGLLVAARRRR